MHTTRPTETMSGSRATQERPLLRPRPKSMHHSASFQSGPDMGDKSTGSKLAQPSTSTDKSSATPTTASSRSRSLRKPNTIIQPSNSSGFIAHTRAQSSDIISLQRRDVTNAKAPVERAITSQTSTTSYLRSSNLPPGSNSSVPRVSARLGRAASLKAKPEVVQAPQNTYITPRSEVSTDIQSRRRDMPSTLR